MPTDTDPPSKRVHPQGSGQRDRVQELREVATTNDAISYLALEPASTAPAAVSPDNHERGNDGSGDTRRGGFGDV